VPTASVVGSSLCLQVEVNEVHHKKFQEFRSSGVQEFRSSGVQEFRSSGVQEFRSSGVQEFRLAFFPKLQGKSLFVSKVRQNTAPQTVVS